MRHLVELGELTPVSAGVAQLGSGREIGTTIPQGTLIRSYFHGLTSFPAPAMVNRVAALGRAGVTRRREERVSEFGRGYAAAIADVIEILEARA